MDPSPPDPPDPPNLEDLAQDFSQVSEFRNQPALSRIKANYAYARGATGAGVTVGVIDSGIDSTHLEFEGPGKLHPDSGFYDDYDSGTKTLLTISEPTRSEIIHGTVVSGVLAANRNPALTDDVSMHGVAFDAQLLSVGISLGSSGGTYIPIDLSNPGDDPLLDEFPAAIFREVNSRAATVNLSIGFPGGIERYSEREIRDAFPRSIEAVAQATIPAAERTIYVWAAGNARNQPHADGTLELAESVEILAGLPHRIRELRGHSLAVVAVDTETGVIADFSNRCGIAYSFCLAAPGTDIRGPFPDIDDTGDVFYADRSGTSLAAPLVTGAVALLTQRYRDQLGASEIVARLLETANDTGIYADLDIYGQGLLDLDAATRPRGQTRLLTSGALAGPATAEELSSLASSPAFGDALERGLANHEIAAFDALDAPFFRPLGTYLKTPAAARTRVEDRLWTLGIDARGPAWNRPGSPELRMRVDRVPIGYGDSARRRRLGALGSPKATEDRLGALSYSRQVGVGRAFLGLRSHPGWSFGLYAAGVVEPGTFSDDGVFASPFLALARDGGVAGLELPLIAGAIRVAAFRGAAQWGERRDPDDGRSAGAMLEYRLPERSGSGATLQAGWLQESERLMGSRSRGAFGALRGRTAFAGVSAHVQLGARWTVFATAHAGWTRPEISGRGLLRRLSPLWTSSFGLGITGRSVWDRRDRLSLRLSQPLRVESGQLSLRWATGRTRDRRVRTDELALSLEPSARQIDLELVYARPWAGGSAHFAAVAVHDPDHTRDAAELALLFRYGCKF